MAKAKPQFILTKRKQADLELIKKDYARYDEALAILAASIDDWNNGVRDWSLDTIVFYCKSLDEDIICRQLECDQIAHDNMGNEPLRVERKEVVRHLNKFIEQAEILIKKASELKPDPVDTEASTVEEQKPEKKKSSSIGHGDVRDIDDLVAFITTKEKKPKSKSKKQSISDKKTANNTTKETTKPAPVEEPKVEIATEDPAVVEARERERQEAQRLKREEAKKLKQIEKKKRREARRGSKNSNDAEDVQNHSEDDEVEEELPPQQEQQEASVAVETPSQDQEVVAPEPGKAELEEAEPEEPSPIQVKETNIPKVEVASTKKEKAVTTTRKSNNGLHLLYIGAALAVLIAGIAFVLLNQRK
eukprot:Colp12_sorted_trinity150504_noHs@26851